MELSINGTCADVAWDTAIEESSGRGESPDGIPSLRRANLRYKRRVQEALLLIEGVPAGDVHSEEWLVTPDGALEGTPDLVVVRHGACTVVDFKTGLVTEIDDDLPRAAYAQQIQIYAHLASQRYDTTPERGVLLSFKEGPIDVDVSPAAIEQAVNDALVRRDEFNQRAPGSQPTRAGESTCAWCDHQARCDGYWQAIAGGESIGIGVSIKGNIVSVPEVSRNGLTAVELKVNVGAEAGLTAVVAEIPSDVSSTWLAGDIVGMTRLTQRSTDPAVFSYNRRSLVDRWVAAG